MRILVTEEQYRRILTGKRSLKEYTITDTGEKVGSFDVDLGGNLLKRWNKNDREHVKRIQHMLKVLDYDLGPYGPNDDGVDGKFGPYTEKATKNFQMDEMPNQPDEWDGVMGPNTYNILVDMVEEKSDEENMTPDELIDTADEDLNSFDDVDTVVNNMVKGKNGNIPKDELMYVGDDIDGQPEYLSLEAGKNFKKMRKDALNKGVKIKLTDAYRPCGHPDDFENGVWSQWYAWEERNHNSKMASKPSPDTKEEWLEQGGGHCNSNHGLGKAIDVSGGKAKRWVKKHGEDYGFYRYSAENWHFDYKGVNVV